MLCVGISPIKMRRPDHPCTECHQAHATLVAHALTRFAPFRIAGHADAVHRTTLERTLALTNEHGHLVTALPTTLADLLGSCPSLELCYFNGCMSAALARSVADRGVPSVGWQGAVIGLAAAVVAPEVYRALGRLPRGQRLEPGSIRAAFEHGLTQFGATIADRRRGLLPTGRAIERGDDGVMSLRFELAHPLAALGSLHPDVDEAWRTRPRVHAAGIPVLMLPGEDDPAMASVSTTPARDHLGERHEMESERARASEHDTTRPNASSADVHLAYAAPRRGRRRSLWRALRRALST